MARQEKSLAVCLEMLQDYTAKDFSLFAVLTTADFYSHNSQFHFLSHSPKTSVKFLFSFAALIFFPPQGPSFWHQPLSCRCKGMAAGFGNKRSSLRFSKKERLKRQKIAKKSIWFEFQVVVAVVGFSWQ